MITTRNEEKVSSPFSQPSTIPLPPYGTPAIASAMLPDDVKKSSLGKFTHGLGNVVALTEAIETYRHNVCKGQAPVSAGIAAMASSVTEKLVEGTGAGLFAAGMVVATAASAPIVAPALAITSGVLLMVKAKEAGGLANLAAPLLIDASLDTFKELKASMLQFVKTSYQKFTHDSALSTATYPNVETAMVKLDYLQHLKDQGIYIKFDENQRLLYNWIARETFTDYFQLDTAGKLKSIKSVGDIGEVKLNSDTVKRELSSIYTSLSEVQKQCQLTPETILGSKSIITDEEIGKFFLAHGASPEDVTLLYDNKEHLKIARCAIAHLKEREAQLACTLDAERSLEIIRGTQHFFGSLTQVGMFARSEALMTVGQVGYNIMQMADSIVKLSTTPIGFASIEPMSMLLSAGLGLISTVLGFGDDRDEVEQRRAEQLQAALYTISRQIEELHARFDHIENMIQGVAGMINQVLHNQKILSDQMRDTYNLVRTGFHLIQTVLHDMRAENRGYHDRINSQLSYLIGMTEQDGLQYFREEVQDRINYIYSMAAEEATPEEKALLRKEFHQLESDIRKTCSSHWNGQKEFSAQQSLETPRDLQLSLQFLSRRLADKDDGLGFIAEEVEQMTKIPLITAGIKKELLPATALWSILVFNYIRLVQFPLFASRRKPSFIAELNTEADNLLKFTQYLKTNKVVELLLKNHQESVKEFQELVFERFNLRRQLLLEDNKSEAKKDKVMRVGDYFSSGEDKAIFEKMKHKINYQYFLLQRLVALTGGSPALQQQLALVDHGVDLMTQPFDFNEKPEPLPDLRYAISYYDSLFTAYSFSPPRHLYPYMHESLEKFGGLLYGSPGEEKMLFASTYGYSTDWTGGGNLCLGVNQLDIATGKTSNIQNSYSHVTDPKTKEFPRTFPLLEYKGNFNQTANHVWASFDIANSSVWRDSPKSLVWFSGGSGYVSVFDIETKQWSTIPGKKPFRVPLDHQNTTPKITCYTNIIHKDYSSTPYLLVNQVEWNREKKEAYVRFEVCNIQKKWLDPDEVNALFNRKVFLENGAGWVLKGDDAVPNPNQFFIKIMKSYGFMSRKDDVIYGLIKPKEDTTELEMHYCKIEPSDDEIVNLLKIPGLEVITQSLPVALSQVYQTSSENIIVNGKSLLALVSSVKTKDGKNKLLFINADIHNKHYETHEFELPPIHPIADWQAMRTTVATIMGKPHIIVTLLDPEYRMMIFSYDPLAKKVTRLVDGPTLEFNKRDSSISSRHDLDLHLRERRNRYPGFYPVNTISIQSAQLGEMNTLMISYPKPNGSSAYHLQTQRYPLAPALKVKSIAEVQARLTYPEESALTTPSKLAMGAQLTKQLLRMHPESKLEVKAEIPRENIFPAIDSCKKIQKLMIAAMGELKLTEETETLIEEERQTMNAMLTSFDSIGSSGSDTIKKGVTQLKELYESINTLDGYLRLNEKYALSVGVNINRQIDQLKEKISSIEKTITKSSPHVAQSMFSGRQFQAEIHSSAPSQVSSRSLERG